jgi:hypothetical protein
MSLPLAARGPVSAALGHDERDYRVLGLRARNPAQGLGMAFSRAGVTVAAGKTRFHLSLIAYGRGGTLRRVDRVSPQVLANRVAYPHGGVREWYANGPLGLEQGFDVARAPARGRGTLTLSLALSGDIRARLQRQGVLLQGPHAVLRYGGLSASDARGRTLNSWLELAPGRLLIHVDDRRAVYPLKVDPFVQQGELTASDGAEEDHLGFAVAVSGNTIVAGARLHEVGANEQQGAVYVFTMPASGWANATERAKLTASDGAEQDELGYSVAVSGNTVVAGARFHRVANEKQGAAYVFTMPASGWANTTQTAELSASDGAARDELGYSVAVSGNTVVAGARFHRVGANGHQGAAYVFTMPASGWANTTTQAAELSASDGAAADGLGYSVAVSGNTVVAGAPFHRVGANEQQGAAYVFTMPASGWANTTTQAAELSASDGAAADGLGYSVAVSGNTVVAGARFHQVGANGHQGAVYVFTMPASGWANTTQAAELSASDGAARDELGYSVAVSGNTVVAGARFHRVGANEKQGAVYVFTMPASGWANETESAELAASDGAEGDELGYSVAVSGNTIAAGAPKHMVGANEEQGATYAYTNPPSTLASGGGSSSIRTLPVSRVLPRISSVHQSHSTWRLGGRLARISARKKVQVGTTFSFSLNVPAVISFNFTQRVSGRKVRGKCRAQTKKNRRRPGCQRTFTAGTLYFTGHSGTNTVAFQGRISSSVRLKPGHYALQITAANSAGHSSSRQLTFTIVK